MTTRHEQLNAALDDLISRSSSILIATHERADGDALGSVLALREHVMRTAAVRVDALAPVAPLFQFTFLDGHHTVHTDAALVSPEQYDLVILLDCGDVKRTHLAEPLHALGDHRPRVASIDHHQTTTAYRGRSLVDLSIIVTTASSTAELVFQFLRDRRATVTPTMATALLTGVVTDTGGFQNLATTLESLDSASELMKRGANLRTVVAATMRNKSFGSLQLWGRALSRLEIDPATGIVSTALFQKDFDECDIARDGTEGIANFLNSLGEGSVVFVLIEEHNGTVKGSFRTKRHDIDVRELARKYGGGGHVKAAGFTIDGTIAKTEAGWTVVPTSAI